MKSLTQFGTFLSRTLYLKGVQQWNVILLFQQINILQLHQLVPHLAPTDKHCHWYTDSIQAGLHFQHLGFIHVRCWSCCNMLLYITVNIPNINTSECQSLHSWSLIWVVRCGVFLSDGSSHIVQKNIRRSRSETRLNNRGQSSWLQLGGCYL